MAAVYLTDLIPSLEAALSVPGTLPLQCSYR